VLPWASIHRSMYSAMSKGYKQARAIAGQPCPAGHNKQVWYRYQAVARDSRLARLDPSCLPDSYCALYELTRMSTPLLKAVARSGLLHRKTGTLLLKKIRVSGKVPVRVEIWTEPDEVADLERRLSHLQDEFS
jgi:hypothetical protein